MAWSRLEKVGTIFSRVNGLIRAGALKEEDKPIWFELYKRFPPMEEPKFDRPAKDVHVRKIFYPEDEVRAKFHRACQKHVRENLADHKTQTKCQEFIQIYNSLKGQGIFSEEEIFDKALEKLSLKNMRGQEKVTKNEQNIGKSTFDDAQKEPIATSFRKAREKQDESRSSTDINIKDIFKD